MSARGPFAFVTPCAFLALSALAALSALSGCEPRPFVEGEPRASFVVLDAKGERVGGARISSDGASLVESVVLERGVEQQLSLSDDEARVVVRAGRLWTEATLRAVGGRWRQERREGLGLTRATEERQAGDIVGVAGDFRAFGIGTSLATWWRHAGELFSSEDAKDARFLDLANGRALPLRIEPRGTLEVEREGRRETARRYFAWTMASGITLVASERGELLAVEGLAGGERAVLEGVRVPPAPRRPLPPNVREERFVLSDELGRFDVALTVPANAEGPVPGVVLLAGSGPADLDGNLGGLGLDLYRRLAASLAAEGVAVLRYDKPGIGQAAREERGTDEVPTPDADALLTRAASATRALASRPEVRGDCLFLLGHSEGGVLAPELALREAERVRGLVLLASPARDLFTTLEDQLVAFLRGSGASDEEIARAKAHQRALLTLLRHGRDVELPQSSASAESNAWLKSHLDRSAAASLERLDVPVLAVFGADDLQVLAATEAEPMRQALSHLADAQVVVVPDMDHLLMPVAPLAGPGRYSDPGREHVAFVREEVPRWILSRACR